MFSLCRSMKWTHLPNAGGLYDQDPDLLDRFEIIFSAIAKQEQAEREEEERKNKKARTSSGRGGPRPTRIRNR